MKQTVIGALLLALSFGFVAGPAEAVKTKGDNCTADGDTLYSQVYYFSEGSKWFADKATYSLSESSGDKSNVIIKLKSSRGFVYFNWSSPDNRKGGHSYKKEIDRLASKSKKPYLQIKFIPDQFGLDPNCHTKATLT